MLHCGQVKSKIVGSVAPSGRGVRVVRIKSSKGYNMSIVRLCS